MPTVSVILPTCDRPHLLPRALGSLLRQDAADLEVLLIDVNRNTAPVTETPALLPLLGDHRVRVLDGRATRTAGEARNLGLAAAAGEWITFLDDDDEYRPQKVGAQLALARETGAPMVLCGYEFAWPNRRRIRQTHTSEFREDDILVRAFLGSPALFHRRDAHLRFRARLRAGEDTVYALELLKHHALRRVPNVPQPLFIIHPQPAGTSVHGDKEAVWQAARVAWPLARRQFSRRGTRAFLALARLERAIGGYGSFGAFLRRTVAVLSTRGLRDWRLAVFAIVARLQRRGGRGVARSR
jgi:hypothetical protein